MDLLAGAHTRLYLSHGSVLGAIELLTSLLDQWLQGLGKLVVEVEDTRGTLGINDSEISDQELMGRGGERGIGWPSTPYHLIFVHCAIEMVYHC